MSVANSIFCTENLVKHKRESKLRSHALHARIRMKMYTFLQGEQHGCTRCMYYVGPCQGALFSLSTYYAACSIPFISKGTISRIFLEVKFKWLKCLTWPNPPVHKSSLTRNALCWSVRLHYSKATVGPFPPTQLYVHFSWEKIPCTALWKVDITSHFCGDHFCAEPVRPRTIILLLFLQQPKALSRNAPASFLLLLLLLCYVILSCRSDFSFSSPSRVGFCVHSRVCMCVYAQACIRVRARMCVYVHAWEIPLFTAAADAVYIGHLFPRLLSLKSIVFFLFLHKGMQYFWIVLRKRP